MKIVKIKLYDYNELSEKAKKNVKLYLNLVLGKDFFKMVTYEEQASKSQWFENGDVYNKAKGEIEEGVPYKIRDGIASSMHEVKEIEPGRYILGHRSNGSITYYAKSKEDAEHVLRLWDNASQLLAALEEVLSCERCVTVQLGRQTGKTHYKNALEQAEKAIKKATE